MSQQILAGRACRGAAAWSHGRCWHECRAGASGPPPRPRIDFQKGMWSRATAVLATGQKLAAAAGLERDALDPKLGLADCVAAC